MTFGDFPWQAVAWDIDGTLVDSEPLHHRALLATCEEAGLDLRDIPEERFIGTHIRDVWDILAKDLVPHFDETAFLARIETHYARGAAELREISFARRTLCALHAMGVSQVCASNSGRRVVDCNLAAIGVTHLMRGTISLDDVTEGKPAPEPYLRAAELAGYSPQEMLAVEDSLTGLRSAKAAGLATVLLAPKGVVATEVEGLADFTIPSLTELLSLRR